MSSYQSKSVKRVHWEYDDFLDQMSNIGHFKEIDNKWQYKILCRLKLSFHLQFLQ